MDYIEEMMKTAGVNKQWVKYSREDIEGCIQMGSKLIYPNFTAEKQLEIIKLISDFHLCVMNDGMYDLRGQYISIMDTKGGFPQALAQLTAELIKAGELDKKKVKEVLEK